jgi:hypothetical protein
MSVRSPTNVAQRLPGAGWLISDTLWQAIKTGLG